MSLGLPVERAVLGDLLWLLKKAGRKPEPNAPCGSGRADALTERAIYEAKPSLSTYNTNRAIGQVLMYRQMLGRTDLTPVVVGATVAETRSLVLPALQLGVHLVGWRENDYDLFTVNLADIEEISSTTFDRLTRKRVDKGEEWEGSVSDRRRWPGGEPVPMQEEETQLLWKHDRFKDDPLDVYWRNLRDRCGHHVHWEGGKWFPVGSCKHCDGCGRVKKRSR